MLKAKYFKNSHFLEAKTRSNPSFVSILWDRQVLQICIKWRVGRGEKVKIHFSNWLPRPMSFKPIVRSMLLANTRVSELIGPNHRWNEALIQQNFATDDAETIMRILLPSEPKEDEMLWHYDKKGNYSVKNGYQLALKIKFPDKSCCSNSDPQGWQTIWKLGIPKKVKIFLWRAAKNLLPTKKTYGKGRW